MTKEDILERLLNKNFPTQVPINDTEESDLLFELYNDKYISCSFYSNQFSCIHITATGRRYYREYLKNKDKSTEEIIDKNKTTIINNVNIGDVKNMKNVTFGDNSRGDNNDTNGRKSFIHKLCTEVKV